MGLPIVPWARVNCSALPVPKGEPVKSLLSLMLLAAAMLPALGQAQTINICDRTPQVRDHLLLSFRGERGGVPNCAAVDSQTMRRINYQMHLNDKGITTLRAGDFANLHVDWLSLNNNELTALPDGVFDGLTINQTLHLHGNQLTSEGLPDGVFDGMNRLQRLTLSNNQLAELPAGIFGDLIQLRGLSLNNNQLTREGLPDGVFARLDELNLLDLRNNHLVGLTQYDPLIGPKRYVTSFCVLLDG